MSYTKQGFENNQVLTAQHLISMEEGIISKQDALVSGVNIKTINGIANAYYTRSASYGSVNGKYFVTVDNNGSTPGGFVTSSSSLGICPCFSI